MERRYNDAVLVVRGDGVGRVSTGATRGGEGVEWREGVDVGEGGGAELDGVGGAGHRDGDGFGSG